MNSNHNFLIRWTALPAIALLLSACGLAAPAPTAAPPPTLAPTVAPTSAPPTAVSSTNTPLPTNTPVPAPTETPTPDPAVLAAAQTAEAQAAAVAAIEPDLQRYGFSSDQGSLGWVIETVTFELENYMENQDAVDHADVSVRDFVVQADVTWTSTSGLAGCGFVVRQDSRGQHDYRMLTIRASGAPAWFFWLDENGDFSQNLAGWRDAPGLDIGLGSNNTVALVGQGSNFTVYINGQNMGSIADTQLSEGAVGFAASQESGKTTCTFENGWLWILDK